MNVREALNSALCTKMVVGPSIFLMGEMLYIHYLPPSPPPPPPRYMSHVICVGWRVRRCILGDYFVLKTNGVSIALPYMLMPC
jgi:hypothetical protein